MSKKNVKVTRIASGIYSVDIGTKSFELERFPDGNWLTFETRDGREYKNDYATKRAAIAALMAAEGVGEAQHWLHFHKVNTK